MRDFRSARLTALLVDRGDPARLYAGVVNDKNYGGVFVSTDGGASWQQIGEGLEGATCLRCAQTKDGTVVAGTSHGIFVLDPPAEPIPIAPAAAAGRHRAGRCGSDVGAAEHDRQHHGEGVHREGTTASA